MAYSRAFLALLIAAALLGAAGAEAARTLPALAPAPLQPPSFSAAGLLSSPAVGTAGDRPFHLISPEFFSFLTSSPYSMTGRTTCAVHVECYRLYLALRPDLPQLEPIVSWETASGDFDKLGGANVWLSLSLAGELRRPTFQGLWTDPTTGLSYARNRWYDARTASWLSTDPMGPVDSQNLYAFVGWAPHMGTDPMGLIEGNIGRSLLYQQGRPEDVAAFINAQEKMGEKIAGGTYGAGKCFGRMALVIGVENQELQKDVFILLTGQLFYTSRGKRTRDRWCEKVQPILHPFDTISSLFEEETEAVELVSDLANQGRHFEASALMGEKATGWALAVIGGAEGSVCLLRLGRSAISLDVLGTEFTLNGLEVMPRANLVAIPGDSAYLGALPSNSWVLSPTGQGAHLVERVNVAGREALALLDTNATPRFYPAGTPANAGQAHIRLHRATRETGIALQGGNLGLSDIELLIRYLDAYSDPSLGGIRGSLRTPNSSVVLGTNLTTEEAYLALMRWLGQDL